MLFGTLYELPNACGEEQSGAAPGDQIHTSKLQDLKHQCLNLPETGTTTLTFQLLQSNHIIIFSLNIKLQS